MRTRRRRVCAGDLPEAEQKVVWATHAAPPAELVTEKVPGTHRGR
ncbi:hypothetical protein ABH935_008256 [Catenulispora sp. GAS73]